ncbi:MAG: hypothetical protein H6736_19655 [Alphaproteobacteria bacterium]|nr:hypothetical protein [Alphaproteobacteria bacterium]MCB9694029.1 hypothetical protein [Alphaproteobacteria bacterium]
MFTTTLALLLSSPALAGDKDGDGVPNKTDQCKEEPEDKDGFEDEDGCPDLDNDKDGIPDEQDQKCRNEPEDKDGFEDEDGCPDPDNDGDGVLDAADQCADEKEDGDDGDGCPTVDYDLLASDGWAPAVKSLSEILAANLNDEGCNDAAEGAQKWLKENDWKKLHGVFEARIKRGGEGTQADLVQGVLAAQGGFWASASVAYDLYCKDHALWPTVKPQLDEVFKAVPAMPEPAPAPAKKKKR